MLTYDLTKRGNRSIYEYLYQNIKNDIIRGSLKKGEKLPSKRALSEHLKISIKTVENAYAQLLAEGFIRSVEKRGYYVNLISQTSAVTAGLPGVIPKPPKEKYFADFTTNNTCYEKFPFSLWAKVMRETLSDYDTTLVNTKPFYGIEKLRVEIAKYLYRFRGMDVSPEHIVIGAGSEYLYSCIVQLLGSRAVYGVENPGYNNLVRICEGHRVPWEYVDIDESGPIIDQLSQKAVNVIHVSPAHHYPAGIVMPVNRRRELLDWAGEETERYIIEDDYDCEFRCTDIACPTMQSLDCSHRVIYINTFSKTMIPSLRVSYMVLPEKLMESYISTMDFYSCTVSSFEQYALASFLEKGYFERHIRRMAKYYESQRQKVLKIFRESDLCRISSIHEYAAGTYFLLKIDTALSDVEIKWNAKERGIALNCLSEYYYADKQSHSATLIINYSDIKEEELEMAIAELEELFLG